MGYKYRELNHDIVDRAKLRHFLGLEINGDPIAIEVKVVDGKLSLVYGDQILEQADDIFYTEILYRQYILYTGTTFESIAEYDTFFKPYVDNFKPAPPKPLPPYVEVPRTIFCQILDTLDEKGINYYID